MLVFVVVFVGGGGGGSHLRLFNNTLLFLTG